MLTRELRDLEKDGNIIQTGFAEGPQIGEYTLTEKVDPLIIILDQLCFEVSPYD